MVALIASGETAQHDSAEATLQDSGPPRRRSRRMVQSPDDGHYRLIAHRILDGAVVPFLGAGVNLCGRPDGVSWLRGRYLPSGEELAAYLAGENDYPYRDRTDLLRVSQYVDVM